MNILRFVEAFPTEESCNHHFRLKKEKEGIICKKCGGNTIIGFKESGSGNVISELLLKVEE